MKHNFHQPDLPWPNFRFPTPGRAAMFQLGMMLTKRFRDALALAFDLHASQPRKTGGVPYISHLLAVTGLALEHGANEDEAIAALLHDAVEDQGGLPTLERIRDTFGEMVAAIVEGCTDSFTSDPAEKAPWRERKERYIAHLADASSSVLLVSASDKLHNARCILSELRNCGPACFDKFQGGRDGVLWYYRSLLSAFRARGNSPLLDELHKTVSEIEMLNAELSATVSKK